MLIKKLLLVKKLSMTNNNLTIKDELTEFLLYTTKDSDVKVEIFMHNETVWLPQKRIAELFGVDVSTINEHLKNIYKSHELEEDATIGKFPIVQTEGKREVNVYNLDAILSVDKMNKFNIIVLISIQRVYYENSNYESR